MFYGSVYYKHIMVQRARNDLCSIRQNQIFALSQLQGFTEAEKEQRLRKLMTHLEIVK